MMYQEKMWEVVGDVSPEDSAWLENVCTATCVETDREHLIGINGSSRIIQTTYIFTCTTNCEKQETLLHLKFGNKLRLRSMWVQDFTKD